MSFKHRDFGGPFGGVARPLPAIKAEPEEQAVPRKRRSSFALNILKSEENIYPSLDGLDSAPLKVPKFEPRDDYKSPLAVANRSHTSHTSLTKATEMEADGVEGIREQLGDIQRSLFRVERGLSKAEEKKHKVKADYTRIAKLTREQDELQLKKTALNSSLPFMHKPKPVASVQLPPPFHNPGTLPQRIPAVVVQEQQPEASGSIVKAESYAVKMEFDDDPQDNLPFDVNTAGFYRGYVGPVGKADE